MRRHISELFRLADLAPDRDVKRDEHDTQEKTADEPRSWRVHGEEPIRENHGSTPFAVVVRVRIDTSIGSVMSEK